MTEKKAQHVLHFWHAKFSELECSVNREVTVGEVARYVGQSRGTAKKYIDMLVKGKHVNKAKKRFPNGTTGYVYSIDTYQE